MASTIKDVAKMADVSISTVSRVINDSKPVSPEARRRVLHAIDVLDYKPNEVARSLVTKKSNLIGVIVEDIGSNFISQILRGVEEVGRMYKYDILLSSSYGDQESEMKFANLLAQKQVEGIIVISNLHNPKLEYKLEESKIPYVIISNFYDIEKFSSTIDYEKASYDMVNLLISKGHKNIASLGIRKDYDTIAIHLMNLLLDNNYKTPEDISVTGFGGSYISNIYRPKLTTVKIPYYDIGAVSIRKILKKIAKEDSDFSENVVLPSEILERESVKSLND